MKSSVRVGLIIAMKEEADILASAIGLTQRKTKKGNYLTYTNTQGDIVMLTPGLDERFLCFGTPVSRIGKISAGIITTLLVKNFHPRCIINAGTAGGIKSASMSIGDIVIANFVSSHDIHIPLSGYDEYGIRKIPIIHHKKLQFLSQPYKIGLVSSGESFATMSEEWKIIKQNNALVKEMEAAGILHALEILGSKTPIYVIKSVTDICDEKIHAHTSSEEFRKNFNFAMNELSSVMKEIVDHKDKILLK
jgi:5'-methylthioadenosine/S-adenosylhomocysteine nucleosidase